MTVKPKQRENAQTHRLIFQCHCGAEKRLWVDPDAKVLAVARAHDWDLRDGSWCCPRCAGAE